jgi:hypothetical protein
MSLRKIVLLILPRPFMGSLSSNQSNDILLSLTFSIVFFDNKNREDVDFFGVT